MVSLPRAALAVRHSERLARRSLGFALDADLTIRDAAELLIALSEHDPALLRAARDRIAKAAVQGPTCRRATETLSIALGEVELREGLAGPDLGLSLAVRSRS